MSDSVSVAEDVSRGSAVEVEKAAVFAGGRVITEHEIFVFGEGEFEEGAVAEFLLFDEFGVEGAPGFG